MSYNKCPFNLDIKLWQLVCDEMVFKEQNYLLSCDRNLWHQLRIYKLPRKYGKLVTDKIITNNERYYYFRKVNFMINIYCNNNKITNEGLKYLTNAISMNFECCKKITDE